VLKRYLGVNLVFTPALNTVTEDEIVYIIEYSGDEPDAVKVLTQIQGGEGNNFDEPQEGLGNGHGKGDLNLEPGNIQETQVDALFKGFESTLL
jgi:hypothetical protein